MTNREKAIVMAYTGVVMLQGDDLKEYYDYLSEKVGEPVFTHEIKNLDTKSLSEDDFLRLCGATEAEIEARKVKKAVLDKYTPVLNRLIVLEQSMREYTKAACADVLNTPYYMDKHDKCLAEYGKIKDKLLAEGYRMSWDDMDVATKYGYKFRVTLRSESFTISQTLSGYLSDTPPKIIEGKEGASC